MDTISLWKHITTEAKSYPTLKEDIEVDVAIVGGGITGLTAALELIAAGKKVAVLESYSIGGGTTGFSTGNLYIAIQTYYTRLQDKFNFETVIQVAHSRKESIDYIERQVKEKQISCNFTRRPMYFYANEKHEIAQLSKEVELLKKAGISIDYTENLPLTLPYKKAAVFQDQARFNPLQYVYSLAEFLKNQGCLIFEHARVMEIQEKNKVCVFKTKQGKVTAKQGILATHTPTGVNPIQLYTAPYRSYVLAVELQDNTYPEINCWNLETPHYAISTQSMSMDKPDLLVIAGSHHKTGQEKNTILHYEALKKYLHTHFQVKNLKFQWSAQHYHSADGLPYIGLSSHYKNIYEATGYFADGLVYGTLSGRLLAKQILQKSDPLMPTYNTRRHAFFASLPFLLKENANIFLQYMKDFPMWSNKEYNKIKKGEGKICSIKGEKCGVYRDENDKLHIVSAVCPHMKCIVGWNTAEKTWDCPCHGSRFTSEGTVIEGPARANLEKRTGAS